MVKTVRKGVHSAFNYGVGMTILRGLSKYELKEVRKQVLSYYGFEKCSKSSRLYMVSLDPDNVKYTDCFGFIPHKQDSALVGEAGGEWDKFREEYDQTLFHKSMVNRFGRGYSWENTEYFQIGEQYIKSGREKWRSTTIDQLQKRLDQIDMLYDRMKRMGIKSQLDLYQAGGSDKRCFQSRMGELFVPDELRIAIGRNGEIIRTTNGKHRISIAKIIGSSGEIPAIVQFQHEDWCGDESDFEFEEIGLDHPLVEVASN